MCLKIYLLGQFNLQANDRPLDLPSRPAQSLLAYLALNAGVTHRREKLAGLLWPEATETNARNYLRQALWRIRKSLESGTLPGDDYLQISDISVTFDEQADYWLDAEILLKTVEMRPVEEIIEIVGLYRGELLPGFYDEWIFLERDRLQAAYQQKMNLLLERLIQAGRWDDALKWSEQWILLGHSPEPAFRALMNAYAGLGDQGMISVTYQRCVESLDRELGLEPSSKTQQLYEQLRRGELAGFSSPPPRFVDIADRRPSFLDESEPYHVEKPIFVARERELRQLDSFLNLALANQGRVIFITGDAGSGKTALIHEFTRRAQDAHVDLVVASGNCNAHTGIGDPYLPFREILELLTGDVEARYAAGAITIEHARLLWNTLPLTAQALVEAGPNLIDTFIPGPGLLDRAKACTPGGADWLSRLDEVVERKVTDSIVPNPQQSDLFELYSRVLGVLARKAPLVLVVDDLQWADLGSISLLFHLGRQIAGCRILILCAYRPEEVALGRDGERHPLEPVVNELQREFGEPAVNVDQAERQDFLGAILDNEPNRLGVPFRKMLFRQTRGHPLFTIELLRGMQERGDLVLEQGDQWTEGPALDWETLPARVEAVIAERIGRLAQPLRAALRVASVEGDIFTAEVVARIRAADEGEMLGCLSRELDRQHRLIRAHSIQRIDGRLLSYYRFRHTLFQKYLYSTLDQVERVHLHEQVGTVLEDLYGDQQESAALADIAPQLARHFEEARITEKAIHYLHQAGERAVQLSAYQEGIAHLTRGLALLTTLPDSPERDEQELALRLALGMAWRGDAGFPDIEVHNAYTRARELGLQLGKTFQLCQVVGELAVRHYVLAEHDKALQLAEEALSLAQQADDPLLIASGNWLMGFILFCHGKFTEAREHLGRMIAFYDPEEHHRSLVFYRGSDAGTSALSYDACCLWCLGYPDQALSRSQEALALARELGHPFSLADVLNFAGCTFNELRRDWQALKDYAEEMIRLSNEKSFRGWLPTAICLHGEALAMLGQRQEGIVIMREGLETAKALGQHLYQSPTLCILGEALAKDGQIEEGLDTLSKALAQIEETNERHWEAELYRMRGELHLMLGEEDEAEASFEKAIEVARRQSAKSWELRAATGLARLWQKQGRRDEAQKILVQIYGWFTEGFDTPDLREARALLEEIS